MNFKIYFGLVIIVLLPETDAFFYDPQSGILLTPLESIEPPPERLYPELMKVFRADVAMTFKRLVAGNRKEALDYLYDHQEDVAQYLCVAKDTVRDAIHFYRKGSYTTVHLTAIAFIDRAQRYQALKTKERQKRLLNHFVNHPEQPPRIYRKNN